MTHDLKCWPDYFQAIVDGRKTFEIRRSDRGFAVGDTLRLREWVPLNGPYTGREVSVVVRYVLDDPLWVSPGNVAMSIAVEGTQPDSTWTVRQVGPGFAWDPPLPQGVILPLAAGLLQAARQVGLRGEAAADTLLDAQTGAADAPAAEAAPAVDVDGLAALDYQAAPDYFVDGRPVAWRDVPRGHQERSRRRVRAVIAALAQAAGDPEALAKVGRDAVDESVRVDGHRRGLLHTWETLGEGDRVAWIAAAQAVAACAVANVRERIFSALGSLAESLRNTPDWHMTAPEVAALVEHNIAALGGRADG